MKTERVLRFVAMGILIVDLILRYYFLGAGPWEITAGAAFVFGGAIFLAGTHRGRRWAGLIGVAFIAGSTPFLFPLSDLTNLWNLALMLAITIPILVLIDSALSLTSKERDEWTSAGITDLFKKKPKNYDTIPFMVVLIIASCVGSVSLLIFILPTSVRYLSGQNIVFIQSLVLIAVSLLLSTPLLGTFTIKLKD